MSGLPGMPDVPDVPEIPDDFTVLDIESTGLDAWKDELVAIGLGDQVYRPKEGMQALTELLSNANSLVVAHSNFDLRTVVLKGAPFAEGVRFHDTKVMAYMLDMGQELSLDALCQRYLGVEPLSKPIKQVKGVVMMQCSLGLVPITMVPWDEMVTYNMQDLEQTAALYRELRRLHIEAGSWERYFLAEEAPLSRLLVEMEIAGMPINEAGTRDLLEKADSERQRLDAELVEATGVCGFNLKSGDMVAAYLYDELPTFKVQIEVPGLAGIPKDDREQAIRSMIPSSVAIDRIGTKFVYGHQTIEGLGLVPPRVKMKQGKEPKRPPIDAENLVLLHGQDPWVSKYLRWKSLNTLCTNYLETWVAVAHNGRLHGRFDQARAETGRIASRDPNLQAIPVVGDITVRHLLAAPLMIGDYSGLDARVAAHFSGDPIMLEIFRNDLDLYGTLASEAWGGPADKTNQNRTLMKILMLSAQYGAHHGSIGDKIRISGLGDKFARKAPQLLANLQDTLSVMFEWREGVLRDAQDCGYIETITGRKRYLPELYSSEWWRRTRAERQCVASKVQGTSADIVRRAMIRCRSTVNPQAARMVLQVHDEILWERGPEWTDDTFEVIRDICDNGHTWPLYVEETGETLPGFQLLVPMKFSCGLGDSWEEKGAQGARAYRQMSGKKQELAA